MAKNAAVVLSGCGVFDGSEIHESVLAILNLQRAGANVSFFAPDIAQRHALNHITGAEIAPRNVLEESARIARGNIAPLSDFDADKFDAIVFPGGFGAAKNLCTFAFDGANCTVNPDVERAINAMLERRKPQLFMCIAPVVAARVISNGVKLTIGNDRATAAAIEQMGAKHIDCPSDGYVFDETKNIYSTPAYMLASTTAEIDKALASLPF